MLYKITFYSKIQHITVISTTLLFLKNDGSDKICKMSPVKSCIANFFILLVDKLN